MPNKSYGFSKFTLALIAARKVAQMTIEKHLIKFILKCWQNDLKMNRSAGFQQVDLTKVFIIE